VSVFVPTHFLCWDFYYFIVLWICPPCLHLSPHTFYVGTFFTFLLYCCADLSAVSACVPTHFFMLEILSLYCFADLSAMPANSQVNNTRQPLVNLKCDSSKICGSIPYKNTQPHLAEKNTKTSNACVHPVPTTSQSCV